MRSWIFLCFLWLNGLGSGGGGEALALAGDFEVDDEVGAFEVAAGERVGRAELEAELRAGHEDGGREDEEGEIGLLDGALEPIPGGGGNAA